MNETFKQQVFEIIKMIPKGRVTTYGAISKAVGFPNHSRHVGNALRNYDEDQRLIIADLTLNWDNSRKIILDMGT